MKNLYTKLSILLLIIFSSFASFSQVLITDDGSTSPDNSAMLEIKSNSKGMLIPRLTTGQRTGISSPVPGLLVFDKTIGSFFIYGKNSKGTNAWIDLSVPSGIWETDGSNVYLADTYNYVGIGTKTPTKKLVIQASNDSDTLMEVLDKDGKPLMILTPKLTKFYFHDSNKKGVAKGFAVGRYSTLKYATSDTSLFLVTPDSTRVYTYGAKSQAGGFALGKYETLKKGAVLKKYFFTDIDSTRVYTSGAKSQAGGFALGKYETLKGSKGTTLYNYMYMLPENYFLGHQSGEALQNSDYTGKYNTFFGLC